MLTLTINIPWDKSNVDNAARCCEHLQTCNNKTLHLIPDYISVGWNILEKKHKEARKKKKIQSNMKRPHIHGAFNIFSRENTASLEEMERKPKPALQLPVEGFYGLMGPHWEKHTSAPQHYTSNDYISIFLEFGVIKFLLFFWPKTPNTLLLVLVLAFWLY